MKLGISRVCPAFDHSVVGTRVNSPREFILEVKKALEAHNLSADRMEGQHFLMLPERAVRMVSAGVGRIKGRSPQDFVLREHRGQVSAYLHRDWAEEADGVAAVVYTLDAYMADPEVDMSAEDFGDEVSHVIVAVLAFAGPQSPLTSRRFVSNLAGGNREALGWDADEIRSQAKAVDDYWSEWRVVADEDLAWK